VLCHSAWL
jgi:hypothetical protein